MGGPNRYKEKKMDHKQKVKKTYADLISLATNKRKQIQYIEDDRAYHVFIVDDAGTVYQANIYKSSFVDKHFIFGVDKTQNLQNETDFLTNYKALADESLTLDNPRTDDKRDYLYTTSRPVGTHTYFTSVGDDVSNYRYIGGGHKLQFEHKIGDGNNFIYFDFNVIDNATYVHEGYLSFIDCNFDQISFHFVPRTTDYIPSTNTFYNLYNGYLIVPAAGDGSIDLTEQPYFVEAGETDGVPNPGFWNADFDYNTGQFTNIQPAPLGDGKYNIFAQEIIIYRMLENIILVGSGNQYLETSEHGKLLHGMRLKISYTLNGDDHEFKVSGILVLYRDKVTQTTR